MFWWAPLAAAGIAVIGNAISQQRQRKHNMELAKYQAQANERYLQEQLAYNTPKAQMARWQEANMNPNLAYGQGNPGNQAGPLSFPDIGRTNIQSLAEIVPLMNQSMLAQSQVQAQNAKTRHTYAMTELNKLQQRVLEKNPLLDESGFKAIIDGLKSSAELKAADAGIKTATSEWFTGEKTWRDQNGRELTGPAGVWKMQRELDLIEQRFNLGVQDQKIKSEILKSKEFQNAILEVQKKFMVDKEITPQHIMQFIQLLLMKML